jgi:hypothetical protein
VQGVRFFLLLHFDLPQAGALTIGHSWSGGILRAASTGGEVSRSSKAFNRHAAGGRVHGAGVIREQEHDPYRPKGKWPDGTHCPHCGAIVHRGSWRWSTVPVATGATATCPACQRVRGADAAGVLVIESSVLERHSAEVRATIATLAQAQSDEHPLERVLGITDLPDGGLMVQTTGLHVLRRLGHGLERAYAGHLETRYMPGQLKGWMRLRA